MTRLFKVSLSVIAMLLVALMVFTACGSEALTKAEEAEKAVVEATEELEAAIAKKADAKELTDKVAQLNAAIQAAQTVATDGDASLKAAIEDAKAALTANVETLLQAHKIDVAGLIAGKASKEDVNKQVADLKNMVANIESATLAAIDLKAYVDWTTVAAAYAYELDNIYLEISEYKTLYTDAQWAEIHKAYKVAEVSIYRSFGTADDTSMADAAFNAFKAVIAANPNAVDAIYYGKDGVVDYIADAEKTALKAQALYNKVDTAYAAASDTAKALFVNYYVIDANNNLTRVNLLTDTLGYWRAEIAADVNALGRIHPVYSANTKFSTDAADFAAAEAQVLAYNDVAEDDFTEAELAAFLRMQAFGAELDNAQTGAVVLANQVKALAYPHKIALTHQCVDAINAWNAECVEWETKFLKYKPANFNTEDGLTENEERFIEVKKLIDETRAALDVAKKALGELAAPFKAEAKPFMDLVAQFYVSDEDLTLDTTKVTIVDGADIAEALKLAKEWAAKYPEILNINIEYSQAEKKPADVLNEAITLADYYANAFGAAVREWNALDHATLATFIDGSATATVYDEKIFAAVDWFETYLVINGKFTEGCTVEGLEDATKDYYDAIVALETALNKAIADKAAAATKLQAALNDLADIKLSEEATIATVEALKADYDKDYVADNALNATRGFTVNYGTAIADAKARIENIKAAKTAMDNAEAAVKAAKLNAQYPFFTGENITAETAYEALVATLSTKINEFSAANGGKETYAANADKTLADATELLRLDDAIDATLAALEQLKAANTALKNATDAANALPAYFADAAAYTALKETLAAKITAYEATLAASAMEKDEIVATANANIATANYLLAKQAEFAKYEAYAATATAGKPEAVVSEINTLLASYKEKINALTTEDLADAATLAEDLAVFKAIVDNKIAELV